MLRANGLGYSLYSRLTAAQQRAWRSAGACTVFECQYIARSAAAGSVGFWLEGVWKLAGYVIASVAKQS